MNDGLHLCFLALITCVYWIQLFSLYDDFGFLIRGLVLSSGVSQTFVSVDRWISYGHFPLSNLYESLGFLSWVLTTCVIVVQLNLPALTASVDRQLQRRLVDRLPDFWVPLILNRGSMDLPQRVPMPAWAESPRGVGLYHDLFGALLMPVVTLINLFAFCLPESFKAGSDLVPALQSHWLVMHVVVMIAAYAFLLLGCCFALAYLVVRWTYSESDDDDDRRDSHRDVRNRGRRVSQRAVSDLRADPDALTVGPAYAEFVLPRCRPHRPHPLHRRDSPTTPARPVMSGLAHDGAVGGGPRRPTIVRRSTQDDDAAKAYAVEDRLQALTRSWDNQSYRSIGLGFPLLTLGLLSGAVWANQTWGSYWSWDPKETWALITWFIFAIYLHTRLSRGWNGSSSASLAMVGFGSIWVCYLGVNLMAKGLHSYGFFGGA